MHSANPQNALTRQYRLALLTTLLALVVITFGAYVRLSDAGLGCPDWPGCYGQLGVPSGEQAVNDANENYPQRPLEAAKAWKEMLHRYLASGLGLCIVALAVMGFRNRQFRQQPVALPIALVGLVIFQGMLGMWTVTLLVKPAVVTAHLLGGLATLSLLWLLCLKLHNLRRAEQAVTRPPSRLFHATLLGTVLLIGQIFLGGWTSTNYAALNCTEIPTCYGGQYWPEMDFSEAFVLWRELGVNYEFGVLEPAARTAIHVTHRIGAVVVASYLLFLVIYGWRSAAGAPLRGLFGLLFVVLGAQLALGISNVLLALPLPIAVAHNGGAALLLLCLVTLLYALRPGHHSSMAFPS